MKHHKFKTSKLLVTYEVLNWQRKNKVSGWPQM